MGIELNRKSRYCKAKPYRIANLDKLFNRN